jgi:hypothetical protein
MIRKDPFKIDIQDNLYFLVFHKSIDCGFGPSVSLYINGYEFLKFDCFGRNKGHFHIYGKKSETIFFTENTSLEQINKTSYELTNNIKFYFSCHNGKR